MSDLDLWMSDAEARREFYKLYDRPTRQKNPGPKAREGLSRRLRFAVLERDGFACAYCGAKAPGVVLHVDHIHPVVSGGASVPENLVTSCAICNLGKSDRILKAGRDAE